MWHARGDGPVNLNEMFTKDEGFSLTQAIILNLLIQENPKTHKHLYAPEKHIVQLDNLFTSIKLLTQLQELGIKGTGTVQITKTEHEQKGKGEGNIRVDISKGGGRKKVKVPAKQINRKLAELKLTHAAQIQQGTLYRTTSEDHQVIEFTWKDANIVLFISTIDDGKILALTPTFTINNVIYH